MHSDHLGANDLHARNCPPASALPKPMPAPPRRRIAPLKKGLANCALGQRLRHSSGERAGQTHPTGGSRLIDRVPLQRAPVLNARLFIIHQLSSIQLAPDWSSCSRAKMAAPVRPGRPPLHEDSDNNSNLAAHPLQKPTAGRAHCPAPTNYAKAADLRDLDKPLVPYGCGGLYFLDDDGADGSR